MSAVAALLAATAVLLGVRRPGGGWSRSTAGEGRKDPPPAHRPVPLVLVAGAGAGGLPALALFVDGARGCVLAVSGVLVLATAGRLTVLWLRRRAAEQVARGVVEGCAVLAANLRVGQVPSRALQTAAAACPVLRPAHETLHLGGDVAAVWFRQAAGPGAGGLRELARAWRVAERTGASLTSTLEQVVAGQTSDRALQQVVASELSAPRATGKVMAALPALGLGMGYLLGGDPLQWLAAGPAGWTCTVLGVALACGGVLWIEALARAASVRP